MLLTRRAVLKTLMASGTGAVAGIAGYGYAYERHALRLVHSDLPVSGLAPEHVGLRIALITDLHHSEFTSQADIARAVDLTLAQRPDIVVLGGDYVSFRERQYMAPCAEALAPLTAPGGVFAIMGNHDDDREMPAALERRGFNVLRDRCTTLTIKGAALDLAGIRYRTRTPAEISRVLGGSGRSAILLAHDPRRLVQAVQLAVPAVLSGHTHGGQVVLPVVGAVAAREFPVVAGVAVQDGTSIFVSRGIGTVYLPLRVNCPPEVALITLRRAGSTDPTTRRHEGNTPGKVKLDRLR
jgi:predicted MPP superfamily phosphohydrolase